jgi:hypothetical protein
MGLWDRFKALTGRKQRQGTGLEVSRWTRRRRGAAPRS